MGGLAFAAGWLGLPSSPQTWAQSPAPGGMGRRRRDERRGGPVVSQRESLWAAGIGVEGDERRDAYANLYDQGDASGVTQAIAAHHGVGAQNILLGAGSTEILDVADATFLDGQKQVVGVEPTFSAVYEFARGLSPTRSGFRWGRTTGRISRRSSRRSRTTPRPSGLFIFAIRTIRRA